MTQIVRFHICPGCLYSFRVRLPHPLPRVAVKQVLLRPLVIVPKTNELQVIFGHVLDQSVAIFSKRNGVLSSFHFWKQCQLAELLEALFFSHVQIPQDANASSVPARGCGAFSDTCST